jgi:hypothetical protein
MIGNEGSASWCGRPNVQRKLTSENVRTTTITREGVKSGIAAVADVARWAVRDWSRQW